jgi:hypothetical protein
MFRANRAKDANGLPIRETKSRRDNAASNGQRLFFDEEGSMKFLRYLAIAAVLLIPFSFQTAHAQVAVGIGVGVPYAPPVCAYGYYGFYPYACAPYGYYGPNYFVDGIFIGAGPWFRGGWGYGGWGYRGGFYGPHPVYGVGFRGGYVGGYRGPVGGVRAGVEGFHGGVSAGGGFHATSGGGGFHGGHR